MKFYSENRGYMWKIDRFMFFTESEKCSLSAALEIFRERWKYVEAANEKGGMIDMLDNLMKEAEKSLGE